MKVDQSFEKILTSIKELENNALHLKKNNEISKIDLDLLLHRVRELYGQLLKFDRDHFVTEQSSLSTKPGSIQPEQATEQGIEPEPEVDAEAGKESEVENQPTEKQAQQKEKPEKSDEKEKKKSAQQTKTQYSETSQITDSKKARQIKETQASKNSHEVVADKYQNKKTFRHDNLAQQQSKNDLSSMMQSKPITDLSKAIGVNDKFLFVRELFDGNRDHYHEAIQLLNEIPTFEEAQTYLRETFNWSWDDPVTKKFLELIKRKFAENQD